MNKLTMMILFSVGLVTAVCAGDLEDGRDALKSGKYAKALKLLDAHVKKNPEQAAGYIARAEAYLGLKNSIKATDDFSKAITLDPKSHDAYYGRARLYQSNGQSSKALDDLNEAIALKPEGELLARAYVLRGHVYESQLSNDWLALQDVMEDYNSAVKADPTLAWAYSYRGLTKLRLHGLGGALTDTHNRSISNGREPPDPAAILKEAFADIDKAVELAPKYGRVYALRALARLSAYDPKDKERIQLGLDDLAKSIEYAPRKPDAFQVRAEFALKTLTQSSVQQRPDGVMVMAKSFKNDPVKLKEAIEDLSKAAQYGSTNPMTFRLRAEVYELQGEWKKAVQDRLLACQLDQEGYQQWNDLAWIAATHWNDDARDGKLAVEAAIKANACPICKNPYWLDTLAAAYASAGEYDKAIESQKLALKILRPSDTTNRANFETRLKLYGEKKPYRMEKPKS